MISCCVHQRNSKYLFVSYAAAAALSQTGRCGPLYFSCLYFDPSSIFFVLCINISFTTQLCCARRSHLNFVLWWQDNECNAGLLIENVRNSAISSLFCCRLLRCCYDMAVAVAAAAASWSFCVYFRFQVVRRLIIDIDKNHNLSKTHSIDET